MYNNKIIKNTKIMSNQNHVHFAQYNQNTTKIDEIRTDQKLPTIIGGSLNNVNKNPLDAFKRKVKHDQRIVSQQIKLEEQLSGDFASLPPIEVSFNSGKSFKRMSLSDLEDNFENKPILTPEKKLKKLSKSNKRSILKNLRVNKRHVLVAGSIATMMIIGGLTLSNLGNSKADNNEKIANAAFNPIKSELNQKEEAYSAWIKNLNKNTFIDANVDSDKDGLTNFEEFVIGSNPFNPNSCNENVSDQENLINLINPATCKGIDLESPADIKTFGDIINLPLIKTQIGTKKDIIESTNSSSAESESSVSSNTTPEEVLAQNSEI